MDFETLYTTLAPPVFDGDNYQIWVARMEAHMEEMIFGKLLRKTTKFFPYQLIQQWLR